MSTSETPLKSSRNRKILIVSIVAVLMCAAAIFGTYTILTPQRSTVYLFNDNYAAGTQVSRKMLTGIEVDSRIIAGNTKLATSDYFITEKNFEKVIQSAGRLRSDASKGTALMSSMLTTTGGNRIEMTMKKNAVAVSIAINPVSGVTNDLSAGSRVNVYSCYNDDTTLILQNTRVLSVIHVDGQIAAATLEVDTSDSLRLVNACTYGAVYLGLVDMTGYQYTSIPNPTFSDVNSGKSIVKSVEVGTSETTPTDGEEGIEELPDVPANPQTNTPNTEAGNTEQPTDTTGGEANEEKPVTFEG